MLCIVMNCIDVVSMVVIGIIYLYDDNSLIIMFIDLLWIIIYYVY